MTSLLIRLLPLPPLDGGRVAVGILPDNLALPLARLERYGFFILIGVIFLLPMITRQLGMEIDLLNWLFMGPISYVVNLIANLAGLG